MKENFKSAQSLVLQSESQYYIDVMRGGSIIRVVLVHLGLSWFFPPYSQYIGVFLPVLFFVSGAVSYYSFLRSESVLVYLVKRVVLVVVPFYCFALLVFVLSIFYSDGEYFYLSNMVGWILVWPDTGKVFFPLGQVWFINSLLLMVVCSCPIFYFSKYFESALWLGAVLPMVVVLSNVFFPVYEFVRSVNWLTDIRYAHQLWQSIVLLVFFVLGAIHYRYAQNMSGRVAAAVCLTFTFMAVICYFGMGLDLDLEVHSEQRTLYYVLLSLAGIYFFLSVRRPVSEILKRVPALEWTILYANKYAYSIFLLHTLILFFVEYYLGLDDLGERPYLAILRMLLVVVLTYIAAKPLGQGSRWVAHRVRKKMLSLLR